MTSWPPIQRLRREWDERFMKALARLEPEKSRRDYCGGCGRMFSAHVVDDFAECVRKVLSAN